MWHLAGLDWAGPDFSMPTCRQKNLQVRIQVRNMQACLNLLVDSTAIKMMGEGKTPLSYPKRSLGPVQCTIINQVSDIFLGDGD